MRPEFFDSYVPGGILADEMGLGKTVELLACIFANKASSDEVLGFPHTESPEDGIERNHLKRLRRERVECVCGAVNESHRYKGLWVQCDVCNAWQHADCVGFSAKGKVAESRNGQKRRTCEINSKKHDKENNDVVVMDGAHICKTCSELIQATEFRVATAATLIICPTPILSQWHAEIVRHTNTGSLRILVYEGIKNSSFSDAPVVDIKDLINADVVLTSYDVLKEDLSHDSDRHEGDRRTMRFQKRYPVIPTLLTRIFWWRVCLDEAQMVESNAAASTEMALRLHAKHRWCITGTPIQKKLDDLYGLLKFLKASPFDAFRWWTEVISKPYEEGDAGARIFTQNFLKNILWRSSKVHVEEELNIPPQEECISWLSLSPIEAHFYQQQHETCVKYAQEVVIIMKEDIFKRNPSGSQSPDAISEHLITRLDAIKLFNSLLKLRQACCHPQVGSSGLRALQQSPMTMQEILLALVGKTKIEGEEALRKLVSAINGLAGVAILKDDYLQAISLYKEALSLAEENSEDFRLDPLLNIHIHHNLAEVLLASDSTRVFTNSTEEVSANHEIEGENQRLVKRARLATNDPSLMIESENLSEEARKSEPDSSCQISDAQHYSEACERIRQRFLSVFYSKLSVAQQEFRKSYEQVSNEFSQRRNLHTAWWLEALHQIEQNKDSSTELIEKIRESISGTLTTSRVSRISPCFRSINALKYFIQTGLDSLEESRTNLLDRLLQIDSTMESPREEDFIRVRNCPSCCSGDGGLCVHCELDGLFQAYEARLFRLNKGNSGDSLISAQEAVDFQKKRSALNRFYQTLSKNGKKGTLSESKYEGDDKKRDVKEKVMVSKSPSDLEVVLGIIKNNSKRLLDGEGTSAALKQLLLLEGMRKEYALARSLAIAQAQVLCAYDEIKMATCRLRLKEDLDDDSMDALSLDEIDAASTQNSSDKFLELSSLSRIKGQLRYLKGLVCTEQNLHSDDPSEPFLTGCRISGSSPLENGQTHQTNKFAEACPVCQEKLSSQKMVFRCGHVTCCNCLFAMTEQKTVHHGNNWVMCPTCRQHTDFGSIALADDRHSSSYLSSSLACEKAERHITVQGSYSTKIEAIVRRILSITSADPTAKILVFTSWNDVLDVLEHAFAANRISCVRMKGGRKSNIAISYFRGQNVEKRSGKSHEGTRESNFVQVLLILFKHGANGLNLLEAKHVILVEPLLNPAVEAQAIGRVHRIGQENRTIVHRFIVKDTVEESIYKLNRSRNTGSIVSGNRKNQDLPVLTLKDVESLFRVASSTGTEEEKTGESLRHLPPAGAAAIAAERRLAEGRELHLRGIAESTAKKGT